MDLLIDYDLIKTKFRGEEIVYYGQKKKIEEVYFDKLKYHLRDYDEILWKDKIRFRVFKYFRDDVKYLEILLFLLFCLFLGWFSVKIGL